MENGLESTTEEEIARAMMSPTSLTEPVSRNGTASGMSAPRMPVVEANADTTAPMKQMMSAASRGAPMPATWPPSQSIVPRRSMRLTYVTMPQISSTVGQATLLTAPLLTLGETSEMTTAMQMAVKPTSWLNGGMTAIARTMSPMSVMMRFASRLVTSSSASSSFTIVVCTDLRAARRPGSLRGPPSTFAAAVVRGPEASSRPWPVSRLPIRSRPPNRKKQMRPRITLKRNDMRNSRTGLPGRSLRSTTWFVIVPKIDSGEKPPAVPPLMTMRPMSSGRMP